MRLVDDKKDELIYGPVLITKGSHKGKVGYYDDEDEDDIATCLNKDKSATAEFKVDELVSVAEFGEPIYPYLKPIDKVCNAPDSDLWHTLIEADNYHALQLLEYLYAGKVDCIYIDPPYNTGARDWKYNNDYVDNSDQYRHSKWLSMMEKRLKIAKKLLNPEGSVLIVTIDEKEYLHLGCLLEEMFAGETIQMITSVIKPSGNRRDREFSRCEEYLFYVLVGNGSIDSIGKTMIIEGDFSDKGIRWKGLLRQASNHGRRIDRPKEMLPTLWMKAGAHGACPTIGEEQLEMLILPENKFAVLVDEKAYMAFAEKLDEHPEIETVFIITDSESGYRDMIAGLDVKESYQLYRDYLDNFRINAARR